MAVAPQTIGNIPEGQYIRLSSGKIVKRSGVAPGAISSLPGGRPLFTQVDAAPKDATVIDRQDLSEQDINASGTLAPKEFSATPAGDFNATGYNAALKNTSTPRISFSSNPPTDTAPGGQPTPAPQTSRTIVIPNGATLSGLAAQNGTTVGELMRLNPNIKDPNKIAAGASLTLSAGQPAAGATQSKTPTKDAAQIAADNLVFGGSASPVPVRTSSFSYPNAVSTTPVATSGPQAPDYSQQYKNLRSSEGVVAAEDQLNDVNDRIAALQDEIASKKDAAKGPGVSSRYINGALVQIDKESADAIRALESERASVVDQLNNKNNTISTLMTLNKQSYNDARSNYEFEYSKALAAQSAVSGAKDKETDNARANATVIMNSYKDKQFDTASITPEQKLMWNNIEVQAGLPQGFIQSFLTAKPNQEVLFHTQNPDGSTQVVFKDPKTGGVGVVQTVGGGGGTQAPLNPEYAGIIGTILGSGKFTASQANAITKAINSGDDPFTVVKNNAKNIMGQTEATTVTKFEAAKGAMQDLDTAMKAFYEAGGSTSIISGNLEKTINKLGEVNDPKLVDLATQIQAQLQIYRNAVSGTAYSVQEGADIATIFPGINKSQGLNQAIIGGRMKAFDSTIDSVYKATLGSGYDKLKNASNEDAELRAAGYSDEQIKEIKNAR